MNAIGDDGLRGRLGSAFASGMSTLKIDSTCKGVETANALATRRFSQLRTLGLSGDPVGAGFVDRLAESGGFPALERLDFGYSKLGDSGVRSLARTHIFPRVRRLVLATNEITAEGMRTLADAPTMSSLRELVLFNNPIGDDGAEALSSATSLSHLVKLDILCCDVTASGSVKLAHSKNVSRLESVNLDPDLEIQKPWRRSPAVRPILRANPTDMRSRKIWGSRPIAHSPAG